LAIIDASDRRRAPTGDVGEVDVSVVAPGWDTAEPNGQGQPIRDGSVRHHDPT
jgi:hypothetical protein